MLHNYIKTGFRNLFKHKRYALINITGLAIGVASCLLISMFVKDEFTYDSWHRNGENIYRITTVPKDQDKTVVMQGTSYPEAEVYANEIPEVKNFARIRGEGATVKLDDTYLDEKGLIFTDKGFFEIFDFDVVYGSLDNRLSNLESLVITESTAIKYFGKKDVAGQSLTMKVNNDFEQFTVTSVIEDHPSNSSFSFNMAMSWGKLETIVDSFSRSLWFTTPIYSYVLLENEADTEAVIQKMEKSRLLHNSAEEGPELFSRKSRNGLLALKDVHFLGGSSQDAGASQSYLLSSIALLILIIACFNFANLTLVNSMSRSKEVGVRKTVGAQKEQLVFQFLTEAVLLCSISFIVGVILAELTLPAFEAIIQKDFTRNLLQDKMLLLLCYGAVLFASILSVIYPSLILSRLRVTKVFKGKVSFGGKGFLTKSMVTFQFLLALVFITVTVALNQQHKFLINKDKGYDDNNLIRLKVPNENSESTSKQFTSKLIANPNILSVGAASDLNEGVSSKNKDGERLFIISGFATPSYTDALGIKLLEGRGLEESDRFIEEPAITNVLINESTLHELGTEYSLGSTIMDGKFRIVGVIADYQLFSAKSMSTHVMLRANPRAGNNFFINNIYIRYQPHVLPEILDDLERTWKEILPNEPFQYTFMDEYNANLYKKEALWSKTLNYSSCLAIAVSIMGLLGLVGLTASQRKKEVSIRKVMGASVANLIFLLNQGFTKLLLISILLSVPIAYYIIDKFLQDYINRIEITAVLFVAPLLATFIIAWLTVSSITFKSAIRNPIDDLRYE